jgi:hypothetical protein
LAVVVDCEEIAKKAARKSGLDITGFVSHTGASFDRGAPERSGISAQRRRLVQAWTREIEPRDPDADLV